MSLQKTLGSPSQRVAGVEVEQLLEGDERCRERLAETLYHARAQVLFYDGKKQKLDQGALGMSDPCGPLQLALEPNLVSSINCLVSNFYS